MGIVIAAVAVPTLSASATADQRPATAKTQAALQQGYAAFQQGVALKVSFHVNGTTTIANPNLQSDMDIGPGRFDGEISEDPSLPPGTLRLEGDLTLPPSDGYFIAFGFMPVTTTTEFTQQRKARGTATLDLLNQTSHVDMTIPLRIRARDAKQDGVPLAIGKNCGTASGAAIRMAGDVSLVPGEESVLESTYAIPPFTGCGEKENLDPLLTGLVAGPKNELITRLKVRCIGCLDY
ncbi:hypothetical protein [Haloechinothrix salitolerans]|uniref:Uncharacterized protein n=1 Tax=Haloechinothrix salitolerans TaxID=926830 RepID=A0ABW2C8F5_9PSEU